MGFCKQELTDCGNSFSDTFREKKERKIEMKAMAERFQKTYQDTRCKETGKMSAEITVPSPKNDPFRGKTVIH